MRRHTQRSCDIDLYSKSLSVDIDHYKEKDYSKVDNTISRLGLTTVEQETLNCYMGGMPCKEIADFLNIDRVTVWRRRQRLQVKYKALFPTHV